MPIPPDRGRCPKRAGPSYSVAAAALPTAMPPGILAWPVVTGVPAPAHYWAGLFSWVAVGCPVGVAPGPDRGTGVAERR